MALRWCAAGMIEAGNQFRGVNGHLHVPALRDALERHVAAERVSATSQNEASCAGDCPRRGGVVEASTTRRPIRITHTPHLRR
jgi:hypothetical protein